MGESISADQAMATAARASALPPMLHPPVFPDDEVRTRQARLLHWIQWTLIGFLTPAMVGVGIAFPLFRPRSVIVIAVVDGLGLAWLHLSRRGHTDAAARALVLELWFLITVLAWTAGGLAAAAVQAYLIVVVVAGLLLDDRSVVAVAALCILTEAGLAASATYGVLPSIRIPYTPSSLWLIYSTLILVVLGLQTLARRTIAASLARAHDELAKTTLAQEELRQHRDHLEEVVAERTAHLAKLSTAVEQAPSAILITDAKGIIQYVNPRFVEATGYSAAEAVGATPKLLSSGEQPDEFYTSMWAQIRAGEQWQGEFRNRKKNGELTWDLTSISPILAPDGAVTHFVAVKEDITERRRLEDELTRAAYYDSLTGLPNRSLFFDRLAQVLSLSRRMERTFALLFVDLDGFKAVNDELGHDAGDTVLVEVGRRLEHLLRTSDTAARMGGDEFTLILTDLNDAAAAGLVAGRVIEALGEPISVGDQVCRISASVGVAGFPNDGIDAETLLGLADAAMYVAKREGKNGFRMAGAGDATAVSDA